MKSISKMLLIGAMVAGVYTSPIQAQETLVNQWGFEGNANDTSGNNNNGTITGSPSYVAGKFGQGIYLNRLDSIQKTSATGLPVSGTASWSCNVWLYLTNAPNSLAYFAGFGNATSAAAAGTARGLIAFGAPSNLGIYSWASSSDLASGTGYPLNQWTMVTITHDGTTGTRTIWKNANYTVSAVHALNTAPSTISVGVTAWSGDEFQGIVDEFTIWSGVLGTNDIAGLYASNSVPLVAPSIVTAPSPVTQYAGEYASMSVTAANIGPFTYQWQQDGANLLGQTNATISFAPIVATNAGSYQVIVSNAYGSVTSSPPALVTVLPVTSITTALAAYWPFDETSGMTVADVTGNGNDGQMFNFVGDGSERVPGKLGTALHFRGPGTGLNDYVQVLANNIQPPTTMTIAAWVWVDSISTWASILKNWPNGTGNAQVHFGMNSTNGDLSNYLWVPGGTNGAQVGPVREGLGNLLPLGQWVHVALVCNGYTMQLYRNGAPSGAAVAYGGQINTNTLANTLGMGVKLLATGLPDTENPAYWKGSLDDMGMWTRGLTPAEILSIFVAGAAGQALTNADAYAGQKLPLITGQPQGVTRYAGEYHAQFTVQAVGQGALSYQWQADGVNVSAETNSVLNLAGPFTNSATYTVVLNDTGNGNSLTSAPAVLNILAVTNITTALAGYWPFDETNGYTAFDSTTNSREAALMSYYSDPSQWVSGQIGGALSFDGGSQFLWVTNYVEPANNTLTISAWVFAAAENSLASVIDSYGQNRIGQFRFGLASAGTSPLTGGVISQAAGYVAATEATSFPTGSWQHVALVADGATVRLYRNGLQVATNAYNGTIVFPSAISNMFIGARIADDGYDLNITPGYWGGMIDDLGMWTRGLTAAEITAFMLPATSVSRLPPRSPGSSP
jgi:hypothetical protein